MNTLGILLAICLLIVAVYYGKNEWNKREREAFRRTVERSVKTLDDIKEHAKEFNRKEIVKVTDNIYMAIGYALANSIMIIGDDGVIIVDVTESCDAASEILVEFRKITKKPITDIIYTHNHADHTYGARSFIEDDKNPPNIWAHASILKALGMIFTGVGNARFTRAMRQFGVFLPDSVSAGIGHKLGFGKDELIPGILYPNRLVDGDQMDVTLSGVQLKIVHIPGETDDQIGVWIPGQKAFLCADDLYKAFPNLYAIRGTKSRELMQWVESMDKMIDLEPEFLVPSHTRPVVGRQQIMTLLTEYRDAIQYVHDQSVRLINSGYHPDDIGNKVKLPAKLQSNAYLQEFYGTVKWSAKSVFVDYQGWFSGDPVELDPLTRGERADKMVELVGVENLIQKARDALKSEDFQWALELAAHVMRNDPSNSEARSIKVEALVELGTRQTSVNGRNYYLTAAMETANGVKIQQPPVESSAAMVDEFPMAFLMSSFPTRFRVEDCEARNETLYFEFSEPISHFYIQLRNGIAIVKNKVPINWDIKFIAEEQVLKDVVVKKRMALPAIATGDIRLEGGTLAFKSFMDCFDTDVDYYDL